MMKSAYNLTVMDAMKSIRSERYELIRELRSQIWDRIDKLLDGDISFDDSGNGFRIDNGSEFMMLGIFASECDPQCEPIGLLADRIISANRNLATLKSILDDSDE